MDAAAGRSRPSASSPPVHVVICPWLALGHLLPCLDLAERLASRGHRVSYVSTPRNIARLLPPVRSRPGAGAVDLVALPLPRVEGLPDGAESTNEVPADKLHLHWKAFDGLAAPFAEFLAAAFAAGEGPDWVIADIFNHWAAAAALEHKVPCAVLALFAASHTAGLDRRLAESRAPASSSAAAGERPAAEPRFETERKARMLSSHGESGMSVAARCRSTLERCDLVLMRACLEWEPEPVRLVTTLRGKVVLPLGLLPPSPEGARRGNAGTDGAATAISRWLDAQPAGSVVYVSLGSEVALTVEQVQELALGLELAGTRFLWALRKPSCGGGVLDDTDGTLPPGFEERVRGRGLVAMGWAPQLGILAHGAVGAFLTHCGWNSTIEGLLFGLPLVMLPICGDQGTNARLMEGNRVGVQVARDEADGSFDREGVAAAVRAVMLDEEARVVFVANAKKLKEIVGDDQLHESYIDRVIQQLRSYHK